MLSRTVKRENNPNQEIIPLNPAGDSPIRNKNSSSSDSIHPKLGEDAETYLEHIPYPKSVFFIVSNEFCERFSYYGMRTILSLYLVNVLLYSESDAKIIYHTFTMLVYFYPLLGAIISDSFLGKFRTILYVSIIYAIGNIVLSLAATDPLGLPQRPFSILGLLLIAHGTGGIKPCVSAFGGDQFVLPQQEIQLAAFFSMFYFSINAGSLISTFLTPVLREDVHCFGNENCYPLAFAVPGILMIVSIVIFACGKPLYKIREPEGNIIVKVSKCIGHAIKEKIRSDVKVDHWLDYSEASYGKNLVEDIKMTLKVLVLYIPLPIFWALYDQQGTGWTFQAVRMNGSIGFYTILPDQMQVVNPLLILAFIPLFTYVIYPAFAKCNLLKSPLQRMVCGGFLTAIAFGISAGVSLALEKTYPVLPGSGNAQLRIYNTLNCNATINSEIFNQPTTITALGYKKVDISLKGSKIFEYTISNCDGVYTGPAQGQFNLTEKKTFGCYLSKNYLTQFEDNIEKADDGMPKVRTLISEGLPSVNITYSADGQAVLTVPSTDYSLLEINPGTYEIHGSKDKFTFELGGVYTVLINWDANVPNKTAHIEVTPANSVHMLWLLPQYIIITAGEVMFSITGLEFSYSQAPKSMKAVLQACFLLTTAIGNLIIVIIESAKIFEDQSSDFFLYTALMVVDMLIFALMAMRYKYIDVEESSEVEDLDQSKEINNKQSGYIDNPAFNEKSD